MPTTTGRNSSALPILIAFTCCALAFATLAIPVYVIRPFRAQAPEALAFALHIRRLAPLLSGICAAIAFATLIFARRPSRILTRLIFIALVFITITVSGFTHVNLFEQMFHPYPDLAFDPIASAPVDADDMLLSVTRNNETHAYPIRTMGYHHVVNDTVAGLPIAATYCTLCHTGMVYSRILDGRTLYFHLAGINNGNALIRDRETGTIWQQSTGEAIFGPLKGRHLTVVPSDELSFRLLASEQPAALVLRPDAPFAGDYDPKNWESHIVRNPVVVDTTSTGIEPHTLMLGISAGGASKAYPVPTVLNAGLIEDRIGDQRILILLGPDDTSLRAFHATPPTHPDPLTFLRTTDPDLTSRVLMIDLQTRSEWNFHGCAISGPLTGQCLPEIDAHKDFWFDWWNHNPATTVYRN